VPSSAFHFKGSSILAAHVQTLKRSATRKANGAGGDVLSDAFENAVDFLVQALGPDLERWRWGALHQAPWRHPVGAAAPMIDRLLNLSRGPYPVGGDEDTPNQTGVNVWRGYEASFALASFRQLHDVGEWDRSLFVLPPGQSGHPGSPHYDDQLQLWLRGEYAPLFFSREAVAGAVEQSAVLRPA